MVGIQRADQAVLGDHLGELCEMLTSSLRLGDGDGGRVDLEMWRLSMVTNQLRNSPPAPTRRLSRPGAAAMPLIAGLDYAVPPAAAARADEAVRRRFGLRQNRVRRIAGKCRRRSRLGRIR